ncbi:hypothetical protein B0I72DRAFT_110688 [Yarrowia lipolytica]|nr:hypothetical protein B0I72DRAFT_110688 [Yarrowia lipolytica]
MVPFGRLKVTPKGREDRQDTTVYYLSLLSHFSKKSQFLLSYQFSPPSLVYEYYSYSIVLLDYDSCCRHVNILPTQQCQIYVSTLHGHKRTLCIYIYTCRVLHLSIYSAPSVLLNRNYVTSPIRERKTGASRYIGYGRHCEGRPDMVEAHEGGGPMPVLESRGLQAAFRQTCGSVTLQQPGNSTQATNPLYRFSYTATSFFHFEPQPGFHIRHELIRLCGGGMAQISS